MAVRLANQVRIEQTCQELEYLWQEIEHWWSEHRRKDTQKQYHTQLNSLYAVLTGALKELRTSLSNVYTEQDVGEIYNICRLYDKRLVWIHRLWSYFRSKFDQRNDSKLQPVLAAADEVVWSCYAGIFRNAAFNVAEIAQRATPLPYIEPSYSPRAIPRTEPPSELKSEIDPSFLQDFLNQLPIPVVSLPPNCVQAPWWLIYLGHEVGHHVQYDLLPNWILVQKFGELLTSVVQNNIEFPNQDEIAKSWQNWGREIFADVFSVMHMGYAAVWSMTELEMADERTMLKRKLQYPAPVVRLALMAHIADRLGVNGQAALHGLCPEAMVVGEPVMEGQRDLRQIAATDLKLVPKMAAAILEQPLADIGHFPELCGWNSYDFAPHGTVDNWVDTLRGRIPLYPEQTLSAARLIISGAVSAWVEVSAIADDEERADEQARLAKNVLEILPQSREEGTRAAEPPPAQNVEMLGNKLARLLLEASPEQLGV
jgi:hypothetical protein